MNANTKALRLLSRAEVSLAGAEKILRDRNMREVAGELVAVNSVIEVIRRETAINERE